MSQPPPWIRGPEPDATVVVARPVARGEERRGEGGVEWLRAGTPLLDLRALASSTVVHVLLLLGLSAVVLSRLLPEAEVDRGIAMEGELGPVDNRAPTPGGGGAGELGGTLDPDQMKLSADGQTPESQSLPDPTADALLEEILPTRPAPRTSDRAAPGPLAAGAGVLPGPGTGGGGGSGGGSGGGQGEGVGIETRFFGARERASSFAYVIDRSASMTNRGAIDIAKRELLASLAQLPPEARFGVVFYNERPTPFLDARGRPSLMSASAQNKTRLQDRLATLPADGGTDHVDAIRAGIELKPEVIFFLTDADQMNDREAETLAREAGGIRIQAIEFGVGPESGLAVPLRNLARATGGSYRYIDVMTLSGRGEAP